VAKCFELETVRQRHVEENTGGRRAIAIDGSRSSSSKKSLPKRIRRTA
jgi:hypothetical protein